MSGRAKNSQLDVQRTDFLKNHYKVVLIKKTGADVSMRNWFWNTALERVTGRMGLQKPYPQNISIPTYPSHPFVLTRELQCGDIVFYHRKPCFAILLEKMNGLWLASDKTGKRFRCREFSITFVSSNMINKTEQAEKNVLGATTSDEIDFAEALGEYRTRKNIGSTLPNIPISEKTLLKFHHSMFKDIYAWAGKYRTIDLVVGKKNDPTTPWKEVPGSMNAFFKKIENPLLRNARKGRDHVLNVLVEIHRELAWIHPFQDGNGRVIRILLEVLALQWGYRLNWNFSGRKKHFYHFAVRRAVSSEKGCDRYLRHFLGQSLLSLR